MSLRGGAIAGQLHAIHRCSAVCLELRSRPGTQVRALYAPLTYTVAALFMWSTHAYLGLIDLDEFLLITRHQTSVQQLLALPECFDR